MGIGESLLAKGGKPALPWATTWALKALIGTLAVQLGHLSVWQKGRRLGSAILRQDVEGASHHPATSASLSRPCTCQQPEPHSTNCECQCAGRGLPGALATSSQQSQDWINEHRLQNTECDRGLWDRGDKVNSGGWARPLEGRIKDFSFPLSEDAPCETYRTLLCSVGLDVFALWGVYVWPGLIRMETNLPLSHLQVWIPEEQGWFTSPCRYPGDQTRPELSGFFLLCDSVPKR